jgi:hypothetical protein
MSLAPRSIVDRSLKENEKTCLEATAEARATTNIGAIKSLNPDDARQLYDQVCTNHRTTDEISFKLLGFVPLTSGGAIALLLSTNASKSNLPIFVFIGFFGALVTFGLYRWELKNIGICHWLAHLGRELERHRLGLTEGQFLERPHPDKFLGRWAIEKPQSEKIIYWTAILAWFLLPWVAVAVIWAE